MEDHCAGLHLFSSCWKYEEEKPDCVHHGRGWVRVCSPALHPGQWLPPAPANGRQLQETPHQSWRCQQYFSQQVCLGINQSLGQTPLYFLKRIFNLKRIGTINSFLWVYDIENKKAIICVSSLVQIFISLSWILAYSFLFFFSIWHMFFFVTVWGVCIYWVRSLPS